MNAKDLIQQLVPTLYEDEYILAVAKPSGIDTSALRPGSAPGLLEILTDIRGDGETLRLANRLSRYESGVLVLAKDAAVAESLRAGLKRHHVKQEYLAVVLGKMEQARLVIGSGRDEPRRPAQRGRVAAPSRRPVRSRSRPKNGGSLVDRQSQGQTVVKALRTGAGRTLVRCRTTAENTHALRAQLRSARLRVLGDKLHEPKWRSRLDSLTCLHLAKVSFRHPASGTTTVLTTRAPDVFARIVEGESDVYRPLHAALLRRLSFVVRRDTNAYRLLTGDVEDMKGLVVERFGTVVVLQVSADRPALTGFLPQIGQWYCRTLGLRAAYAKRFVKDRVGVESEVRASLHEPEPLVGKEVPPEIEINERGMRFVIRPYDGFSVGLFLDQRENRGRVRAMAEGLDVLNLFAYTCGFSVAAALGRATSVTSVDISSKHLDWGRTNFERNGLDPATHHWIRSDAQDYVKRAQRQSKQFDLIILDPPTFAHGKKSRQNFAVERDLAGLVTGAVALLRPGGTMLLSTNHRRISMQGLRDRLREGARGRGYRITSSPPLPPDFCNASGIAKSLFVQFNGTRAEDEGGPG